MGNCTFKGVNGVNTIKVITNSGNALELKGPKPVKDVLEKYPGHGVFRRLDDSSAPLRVDEYLVPGRVYYMVPLRRKVPMLCYPTLDESEIELVNKVDQEPEDVGHAEIGTARKESSSVVEVLPSLGDGVWRVKLVINPKQLEEILSEEGNIEGLIEMMRMAAASSAAASGSKPRQSKSSLGGTWKPKLATLLKVPH